MFLKRVFLSSNIIFDLLDANVKFQQEKFEVIIDLIQNDYEILITSDTVLRLYRGSLREQNRNIVKKIKDLLSVFKIISVDEKVIYKALDIIERNGGNFEEKIEIITAINYNCEMFLTQKRNVLEDEIPFEIIEL
jgi:predicted nucleic acid-binding protein